MIAMNVFTKAMLHIKVNFTHCLYLLNTVPDCFLDNKICKILIMMTYFAKTVCEYWLHKLKKGLKLFLDHLSQNYGYVFFHNWKIFSCEYILP